MSTSTSTTRKQSLVSGFAALALSLPLALSLTGPAVAAGADHRPTAATEQTAPGASETAAEKAAEMAAAHVVLQAEAKPEKAEAKAEKAEAKAEKAEAKAEKPEKPEPPVKAAGPAKAAQTGTSTDKHGTASSGPLASPQPLSQADQNGTGANPGQTCTSAYCSTRDGSASRNGKGDGAATGKPCAGCVGKADNKNPKGQAPNGTDHNAGYECDRNSGIGKTNPAHTGCTPAATSPTTAPTSKPTAKPTKAPKPEKTPPGKGVSDNAQDKVTICHATGSAKNPYVVISPSKQGVLNGHVGHQGGRDIIPPFSYVEDGVTKQFPGQNWNATTQELFGRGCTAANPTGPTVVVCPTTAVVGPVMAGCTPPGGSTPDRGQTPAQPVRNENPTQGGGTPISGQPPAQPARNPVKIGPPTSLAPPVVAQGTVTPLAGPAAAPTRARVAPSTLPFTGTDAARLLELAGLLLLVGGALLLAVRRGRPARAAA